MYKNKSKENPIKNPGYCDYTIKIDPKQGNVTRDVNPNTLIKRLAKSKKPVEVWGASNTKPNPHIKNKISKHAD